MIDITLTSNHYLIFLLSFFSGIPMGIYSFVLSYFRKEIDNKIADVFIDFFKIISICFFYIFINIYIDYGTKRLYTILAFLSSIIATHYAILLTINSIKNKLKNLIKKLKFKHKKQVK